MIKLDPKLTSGFPDHVKSYLQAIIKLSQTMEVVLTSIILFGSLAKGGYKKEISDVDLIIVVDNEHTSKQIQRLSAGITQLEFEYGFREKSTSKVDVFYKVAENMTGMFISHFICKEKDYVNAKFHNVFNVNPILAYLLAPSAIVWNSVKVSSKVIAGKDILAQVKPFPIQPYHVIKSLIMNFVLNIFAYATYLLHPDSTKFSLEAVKWTLHSCYFCITGSSASVEEVAEFFSKELAEQNVENQLGELISLREEYRQSRKFIWDSFPLIVKIHLNTLMKMIKRDTSVTREN